MIQYVTWPLRTSRRGKETKFDFTWHTKSPFALWSTKGQGHFFYCNKLHQLWSVQSLCETNMHTSYLQPPGSVPCFTVGFPFWGKKKKTAKEQLTKYFWSWHATAYWRRALRKQIALLSPCIQMWEKGGLVMPSNTKSNWDYWLPELG